VLSATRLLAIASKEWVQLRRDPRSMFLAFAVPVFLLLFFGYAISWDVRDIGLIVLDQDNSVQSRALTESFAASGYFTIRDRVERASEIDARLGRGRITAALVVPPGFARDLAARRPAQVQLLLDGSDANTATIALNYASAITARHSRDVLLDGRRIEAPTSAEVRVWYNPTLESRHMVVPGLIAVIMSIIAAMLTALTIAREWERGTMEQLASTPVHRGEVVLGKLLPYLAIGVIDVVVTTLIGVLLFQVPFRGSIAVLMVTSNLFLIGALGLGMFISAATRSQLLATQLAMIVTFLPAFLLSGFMYAIDVMPRGLQLVTYLIPARYFVTVTRGVFLKGVGPDVLFTQALMMLAFAAVGLFLSTRVFRKEIA
jgi:ABC-2 type transport system permease protein